MAISPGGAALLEAIRTTATERPVAESIVRKTTYDQVADAALSAAADAQTQLANPDFVAEREIDLAKAAILGNLRGLLPNANLATIQDATKLGSGVVLAEAMAVQNAAALNLWVQDAAIESAKIKEVVADKIAAGIISAAIGISSGGYISAGGARLDSLGVRLTVVANYTSPPNVAVGSKLTPFLLAPFVALQFYDQNSAASRGASLWADGRVVEGKDGAVRLVATDGSQNPGASTSATVQVVSAKPGSPALVSITPALKVFGGATLEGLIVSGAANFGGNFAVEGASTLATVIVNGASQFAGGLALINGVGEIAAQKYHPQFGSQPFGLNNGATRTELHGLGAAPNIVVVQRSLGSGGWINVNNEVNTPVSISASAVNVTNQTGAIQTYRVLVYA